MPDELSESRESFRDQGRPKRSVLVDRHSSAQRTRRLARTDWRLGGRSVRKWNGAMTLEASIWAAAGILVSLMLARTAFSYSEILTSVTLSIGLMAGVLSAFRRARPAGLLVFRPLDILWGLSFGLLLRLLQGISSSANELPFPTTIFERGQADMRFWVGEVVLPGLVGPVAEEFFFRAVLLLAVYQALRRSIGRLAAATTATLVSAGCFVMLHSVFANLSFQQSLQLVLVGLTGSLLVLLTGRVWPAVGAHLVYNLSYIGVVALGTAST